MTHNSWFIGAGGPLERIFGCILVNSDGREVSVRDIGEQHILEDFGSKFIPTAQDYLQEMEFKSWMNNGVSGVPSSHSRIEKNRKVTFINLD